MISLKSRNANVVIDPASGGRITSLKVFGFELLVSKSADPIQWGCYPMAPWAGRVRNGRFVFDKKHYQLPQLMPPHAIHGTTFIREWSQNGQNSISVPLGEDWPFAGHAVQYFTLDDHKLQLCLEVHADNEAFPCCIGWHPWFRRRLADGAEGAQLLFEADSMYCKDSEGIPTGELCVPTIGPWDDCFTGFNRLPCLLWPGLLKIELKSTADHWVVYNERNDALCVEPQTGPPDALNIAPELVTSGKPIKIEFDISWERPG